MPSDLVVSVRQVSSYPLGTPPVLPTDNILIQRGGLGGPYLSASAQTLVETALNSGGSIGVGTGVAGNASPGHVFTATNHVLPLNASLLWNAYWSGSTFLNWGGNIAGSITFEAATGWDFAVSTAAGAGQPTSFTNLMRLTPSGGLNLFLGTLTVARDPAQALEVATMGYVGANTVASFNARKGAVQLSSSDVYQALCLDGQIATQTWVCEQLNAAFQAMLAGTVVRWNNRSGNVFLMLSDISCVFMQPGQQPITQTPPSTSDDYSIANTAWVTQYVADTLGGGTGGLGLATETWVKANTVASFNGRIGAVTLALSDITTAGGAPLNSPQLSGVPTAPTQAVGNASAAIATTAFVWSAVQESTTGVVSWNGRTGVVTLTGTDINDAGGALLASPAFTGVPTAPTAATGTTTTQLATCAFVLNEVQAIGSGVTSFNTRSGNVVLELTDIESAGGAPIASPAFSGVPTVPTPVSPVAATTTIANTNWVVQYCNLNTVASFNSRIGAVTLNANDITAAGGLANPNVALTGAPTAPTMVPGTNSTAIATTAFVTQAIQNIGGVTVSPSPPASPFTGQAWFNSTAGIQQLNVWTGAAWTPSTNLTAYAPLASPAFTGIPTVPTAVAGTANNQAASTGFVAGNYLPLTGGQLTGPLGVGTTIPAGASNATIAVSTVTSPVGTNVAANLSNNGTNWIYTTAGTAAIFGVANSGLFSWNVAPSGAAGAAASLAATMTLDQYGRLTVTGSGSNGGSTLTLYASGTVSPRVMVLGTNRTWSAGIPSASTTLYNIADETGGFINLQCQPGAQGATIFPQGRVVSQGSGTNPSLTVFDTSLGAMGMFLGSGPALYFSTMNAQGGFLAQFAHFDGVGNLTINGTLAQGSDATNKVDMVPLTQGISLVRQLIPKAFAWATTPDKTQWGFIAQDVQPVIPPAVSEAPTPDDTAGMLTLDITAIIAALVYAVKQLDQRCTALESAASISPPAAELA